MQTKPLLYGLIGFFAGGLLVSVAATTINQPREQTVNTQTAEISMSEMTNSLRSKTGDNYDKAFITHMIDHHQAAVDMAKLSSENAQHQEIKNLSEAIISAQEKEIGEMKQWQKDWGYVSTTTPANHALH